MIYQLQFCPFFQKKKKTNSEGYVHPYVLCIFIHSNKDNRGNPSAHW